MTIKKNTRNFAVSPLNPLLVKIHFWHIQKVQVTVRQMTFIAWKYAQQFLDLGGGDLPPARNRIGLETNMKGSCLSCLPLCGRGRYFRMGGQMKHRRPHRQASLQNLEAPPAKFIILALISTITP